MPFIKKYSRYDFINKIIIIGIKNLLIQQVVNMNRIIEVPEDMIGSDEYYCNTCHKIITDATCIMIYEHGESEDSDDENYEPDFDYPRYRPDNIHISCIDDCINECLDKLDALIYGEIYNDPRNPSVISDIYDILMEIKQTNQNKIKRAINN